MFPPSSSITSLVLLLLLSIHPTNPNFTHAQRNNSTPTVGFVDPIQPDEAADSSVGFPIAVVVTLSVIALMALISVTGVCCHRHTKARRDKKEEQRIMAMSSTQLEAPSEVHPSRQSSLLSPPGFPRSGTGTSRTSSLGLRETHALSSFYGTNLSESNSHQDSVGSKRISPACLTQTPNPFQTSSDHSSYPNEPSNANFAFSHQHLAVAANALPADAIASSDDAAPAGGYHEESRGPPKLGEEELASAISRISHIASTIFANAPSACTSDCPYPRHPFPYATNHRRVASTSSAIIRFGVASHLDSRADKPDTKEEDDPDSDASNDVKSGEQQTQVRQLGDDQSNGDPSAYEEDCGGAGNITAGNESAANDLDAPGTWNSSETLTSRDESSSATDAIGPEFSFGLSEKERGRLDRDDGNMMCADEDVYTCSSDLEGSANESLNGYSRCSYEGNTRWQPSLGGYDSNGGGGYPSPCCSVAEVHENDTTEGSTEMEPRKHVPVVPRVTSLSPSGKGAGGHYGIAIDDAGEKPRAQTLPETINHHDSYPGESPRHLESTDANFLSSLRPPPHRRHYHQGQDFESRSPRDEDPADDDFGAMGNVTISPPSMASASSPSPSPIPSLKTTRRSREHVDDDLPSPDHYPHALPHPLPLVQRPKRTSLPRNRTQSDQCHLSPYPAAHHHHHQHPYPFRHHQHSPSRYYSHSTHSTSTTSFYSVLMPSDAQIQQQQQNRIEAERQHEIRRYALSRHPDLASLMLDDRRGEVAGGHRGAY